MEQTDESIPRPHDFKQELKGLNGYIPIIFLLYSWGSLFGVPIKAPLRATAGNSKCILKSTNLEPEHVLIREPIPSSMLSVARKTSGTRPLAQEAWAKLCR